MNVMESKRGAVDRKHRASKILQPGEIAERLNGTAWKASVPKRYRSDAILRFCSQAIECLDQLSKLNRRGRVGKLGTFIDIHLEEHRANAEP